jgi:hypothetical protein
MYETKKEQRRSYINANGEGFCFFGWKGMKLLPETKLKNIVIERFREARVKNGRHFRNRKRSS